MNYGADFNAVDIGAVVLVFLELLLGWRRGLAGSLFRLLGTLAMLLAGLRFHLPFGDLLAQHTTQLADNPEMAGALAFLLIIIVVGLCFLVARLLLRVLMSVTFNEKINNPGGSIVGLIQGLMLVFLLVYAAGLWPQPALRQLFVQNSFAGRAVFKLCPRVMSTVEQIEFHNGPVSSALKKQDQPNRR